MAGKVWGTIHDAFGDTWMDGSNPNTNSGTVIQPPDTDSWYTGDGFPPITRAWYAGGSDGTFHYHLAVDFTGQWWVSKFDKDMTTLLDRWEITGWISL